MAKKTFTVTGTDNVEYDLDKLQDGSRTNSKESLNVEIWEYNPKSIDPNKRNPNPPNLTVGRIWLSKKVDE